MQDENLVGFDCDLTIRREIDRVLQLHGVEVRVVMEFDNIETIKRAIEIDAGVGLLPEPTVAAEVAGGTLVAVPLATDELVRPLGIIHRRGKGAVAAPRGGSSTCCKAKPTAPSSGIPADLAHAVCASGDARGRINGTATDRLGHVQTPTAHGTAATMQRRRPCVGASARRRQAATEMAASRKPAAAGSAGRVKAK